MKFKNKKKDLQRNKKDKLIIKITFNKFKMIQILNYKMK